MNRILIEVDLLLERDPGVDAAYDTWAWALEKQIEEMALVRSAVVSKISTFPGRGNARLIAKRDCSAGEP